MRGRTAVERGATGTEDEPAEVEPDEAEPPVSSKADEV